MLGTSMMNGPIQFDYSSLIEIHNIITLPNSSFLIYASGNYSIFSSDGNTVIKPATLINSDATSSNLIDHLILLNTGNILYTSRVYTQSGGGYYQPCFNIKRIGAPLKLQKVDSNEVRLWNYTDETINGVVSVSY